jgi:hypothetical protein
MIPLPAYDKGPPTEAAPPASVIFELIQRCKRTSIAPPDDIPAPLWPAIGVRTFFELLTDAPPESVSMVRWVTVTSDQPSSVDL